MDGRDKRKNNALDCQTAQHMIYILRRYFIDLSHLMIKFTLLLLAVAATLGSYTVDPHFNVLRDEHNRIRIFHGVNSVYK